MNIASAKTLKQSRTTTYFTVRELWRNLPKLAQVLRTELRFWPRKPDHQAMGTSLSFLCPCFPFFLTKCKAFTFLLFSILIFSYLLLFFPHIPSFKFTFHIIFAFMYIEVIIPTLQEHFSLCCFALCLCPLFLLPLSPSSPSSFTSFPFHFPFLYSPTFLPRQSGRQYSEAKKGWGNELMRKETQGKEEWRTH